MSKEVVEVVKKEAKSHIANARLRDALQCIKPFVERYSIKNSHIEKHFLNIFNEFNNIRGKVIDGILSSEEIRLQENRLTDRFLILLEDFENIQVSDLEDKAKIEFSNQIVPSEFYITKEVLIVVDKLMQADDKIYDLKVTIENKKIEITKTNNKEKIEKLENEIINLRYEISREKEVYYALKTQYDDLKTQIGIKKIKNIEENDFKLANDIKTAFHEMMNDYKNFISSGMRSIKEEMTETFNKDKTQISTINSLLFQYLDDMNGRISKIEKLLNQDK